MEIKEGCYKGTVIRVGNDKRDYLNTCVAILKTHEFTEIDIPIIHPQETFKSKVGQENQNMMFNFQDRGERDLCLAPEYTAVVQKLASTTYKHQKDVKLFYIQECFRGEKPQNGRYRQFTQLGVEVLNPTKEHNLKLIALDLLHSFNKTFVVDENVTRGLDYYQGGKGFEISCPELGSSKQVCGGGSYDGGVGFALGVDRLMLLNK